MDNIICVVGPTASGKTAFAVRLAQSLGGEVISCDSMQIYRRMDIGTAKPTVEELAQIPHHMIGIVEPNEDFSVGKYVQMADAVLQDVLVRGKTAVICGGTGLYVDSLIAGRISQLAAVNLLLQPCSQVPNLIPHRQRQLRVEARSLLHIQRRPLDHLFLNLLPNPRAPPIHKGAFQICLRGQTRIAQQHHQRGGVKFI